MKLLNSLERKLGKYSLNNLMLYIIGINAIVYFLSFVSQIDISGVLSLNPYAILQGQIWRIITFVFVPPASSPIFIILILYFYYMVGNGLEGEWGSFKFNVYYICGMLGAIAAAFISGQTVSVNYLNMSLFLAFAYLFPDYEILLFFIIPVKMKYLGFIDGAYFILMFIVGDMTNKIIITFALINFLVFFMPDIIHYLRGRKTININRAKFKVIKGNSNSTLHRCTICNRTEKDDANLEFRYCSKCNGAHEYCSEHLLNHIHIK